MSADPVALERRRLEQLPADLAEVAAAAIADLDATPGAAWGVRFLGELFYGVTLAEAEAKVRAFARDAGDDAVDQLAAEGFRAWPISEP